MELKREYFSRVRKTVIPRPTQREDIDILGQYGTAWAKDAAIYGQNWYLDHQQNVVEIYDAGPAICFREILPKKDKYAKEGLYLQLSIAYRTTENANVNIRTFSGNHVTLLNNISGAMYLDPSTYCWITDDMTLNINSIYSNEKLWIQRVDWEWVSREIIFEDELGKHDLYLGRMEKEITELYVEKEVTNDLVKEYLINRIKDDDYFAKRCLALLRADKLSTQDMISLYKGL
ncbi:MAG: hypothetical protein V1872_14125 [bacterium]